MGQDKRFLRPGGEQADTLLSLAGSLLQRLCASNLLSIAAHDRGDLLPGFRVQHDSEEAAGPLPALCDCAAAVRSGFVLVLPVDMPRLPESELRQWMEQFQRQEESAVFALGEASRPSFPLLLRSEFLARLQQLRPPGELRLFATLRQAGAQGQRAFRGTDAGDPLLNLNRPKDLDSLS